MRRHIYIPSRVSVAHYTVTVDHTKCGSADSTDFPVLVSISNAAFKTVANGGVVTSSSGYDITFYSDSGFTTLLSWETEFYDAVNGIYIGHVKLGTVSHTSDTVFYMQYGNSAITTFQGGSTGAAWNSNYSGVWHLPDGTTLTANDSIATGHNGTLTNTPTATAGQIDGGANMVSASSQYITMGNNLNITTQDFSISYWLNAANTNQYALLVGKREASGAFHQWQTGPGYIATGGTATPAKTIFFFGFNGSSLQGVRTSSDVLDGNWHYVTVTRTSGGILIYIDGSSATLTTTDAGIASENFTNAGNFNIGYDNATSYYNGKVDEVRVSIGSAYGASQVLTEWNNQNAPGNIGAGSFLTYT